MQRGLDRCACGAVGRDDECSADCSVTLVDEIVHRLREEAERTTEGEDYKRGLLRAVAVARFQQSLRPLTP